MRSSVTRYPPADPRKTRRAFGASFRGFSRLDALLPMPKAPKAAAKTKGKASAYPGSSAETTSETMKKIATTAFIFNCASRPLDDSGCLIKESSAGARVPKLKRRGCGARYWHGHKGGGPLRRRRDKAAAPQQLLPEDHDPDRLEEEAPPRVHSQAHRLQRNLGDNPSHWLPVRGHRAILPRREQFRCEHHLLTGPRGKAGHGPLPRRGARRWKAQRLRQPDRVLRGRPLSDEHHGASLPAREAALRNDPRGLQGLQGARWGGPGRG